MIPVQPNNFYLSPAYTGAQQKLSGNVSGNVKSTFNLIYELTRMTQICLNITNAAFLYTDLDQYILFVCLQIKYRWTEIRNLDGFWTAFPILDGQQMTFWTACLFSPYASDYRTYGLYETLSDI